MSSELEQFETWLLEWEAGTLDDDGVQRVRTLLRTSEEARKRFVELQMISAALKLEGDAGVRPGGQLSSARTIPASPPRLSTGGVFRASYGLAAAAALLICALTGRLLFLETTGGGTPNASDPPGGLAAAGERPESVEATSQGLAVVTRLVDIVWDRDQVALDVGDPLPPGRLAIESGYAQIEFFCGATVILEGPAELDLTSAMLARVRSGRLRAQVPPAARGFAIEVDNMKVVDLGTEFGLSVSPAGAQVQVFDGEVELHQPSEEKRLLTAGQGLVRDADGSYRAMAEVAPMDLVGISDLESRANSQHDARYRRWQEWSAALRRDPRLLTYYAFDESGSWERTLACSREPKNSELDGAIVGARRNPGRWPAKGSLEFKRPADRVRVHIPGEYGSLTFACWAKIDSLDRRFNSLFLTDNYNQGEPHWQILDTGQLYFSVRPAKRGTPGPRDRKILSPPFWVPSMSGRWIHLATTFNIEMKTVTHYLNGKVLSRDIVPDSQLVVRTRIGAASIGNWSIPTMPDVQFAIRNLNGSIDEFALFSVALSDDEVMEMYENGRP